jgi:hypothetical protein
MEAMSQSKEVELIGGLQANIGNLPRLLIPGVQIKVRLTKAKDDLSHERRDDTYDQYLQFL